VTALTEVLCLISDNRVRKDEIVFCADLPPRIYESLKILCCLAKHERPSQAHEIARWTGLPVAQTAKVLQSMVWAGFVRSRRGTTGGFWLVTPPHRIRVSDVIDFFTHRDHTETAGTDCVSQALRRATARCQREFRHITIANLVTEYERQESRKSRKPAMAGGIQ